ncbi:MAG: sensor histidine kinase [Cetobacterium sp.]|uniref:sensor histidine kinase n=1 Tax=Cetobacterium sp. TaxID=2071632 RepID=UPI002FC66CB5
MDYSFEVSSNILVHLGEQLIKNDIIAIVELVKNSYDADASFVDVEFLNIREKTNELAFGEEKIIIEDNGIGMTLDDIKGKWLHIGGSEKERKFLKKGRTKVYQRTPLGEKGIGRFGVHKLGSKIKMITRSNDSEEIIVEINWEKLNKDINIEDFPVKVTSRIPEYFKNDKTGTKIEISGLKNKWDKKKIKSIYQEMLNLKNPFLKLSNFDFNLKISNKDWLKDINKLNEIIKNSLFSFKVIIGDEGLKKFEYKFSPPENLCEKIQAYTIQKTDETAKRYIERNLAEKREESEKIGDIEIEGYIFDFDSNITKYMTDKEVIKKYLSINNGIKVYRDGLRVYNYGELDDDWLELNQRRINRLSKGINKGLLLGAVSLKSDESLNLKEKSNREGFLENDAFEKLKSEILHVISLVEIYRQMDRIRLASILGKTLKTSEPVVNELIELEELVKEKVEDPDVKKEIERSIKRVQKDYSKLKEVFLTTASTGMNMSLLFHEIEKSIDFLTNTIMYETNLDSIKIVVDQLVSVVEGGTSLLKEGDIKKEGIKNSIIKIEKTLKLRALRHNFEIKVECEDIDNSTINCSGRVLTGMIFNLLGNSIDWLKISGKENKKILIKVGKGLNNHTIITIADNGPGFSIDSELAKQIFVTTKPDGKGMGLGLFIVNDIMEKLGGMLLINEDQEDLGISDEFKSKVSLCFKGE